MFELGRVRYEKGGLRFEELNEEMRLLVEEDYQITVGQIEKVEKGKREKDDRTEALVSGRRTMNPDSISLPEILRPLFWDVDFPTMNWETDRDFIVRRILQTGSWPAVSWLRSAWGDESLRAWLEAHTGGCLEPRRLRYWELILDLPSQKVEQWIARCKDNPWERRV